ncbi:MAG: hypothetical protein AABY83_07180 [Pseudomonadota bacterium]
MRASQYFNIAHKLNPNNFETLYHLGLVEHRQSHMDLAAKYYKHCLTINPMHTQALVGYVNSSETLDINEDVANTLTAILDARPDHYEVYGILANLYFSMFKNDLALKVLKQAIRLYPDSATFSSAYLFSLHHNPHISREEVFSEHVAVAANLLGAKSPTNVQYRKPNKKLRIGYVSQDFRDHSVAYFTRTLFNNFDSNKFEVFGYYTHNVHDTTTTAFKASANTWRDIHNLDDDAASLLINNDNIDILFDLSGYTAGNRLGIFARKPSPIQISYIGYPDTTGLATIDYRITDRIADPVEYADTLYTEELIRLPSCFLCYSPPPFVPEITSSPSASKGYITFSSFNKSSKISDATLLLWRDLLSVAPNARLAIKSSSITNVKQADLLRKRFSMFGIDTRRIDVLPAAATVQEHLSIYNYVDIALDTTPYNGTTTVFESLWMGVPVVTLAGDRHVSRVAASILSHAGLDQLVATSASEYVAIAAGLASNKASLAEYRTHLRRRLSSLSLVDSVMFMRDFEHMCRNIGHSSS